MKTMKMIGSRSLVMIMFTKKKEYNDYTIFSVWCFIFCPSIHKIISYVTALHNE